VVGAGNVCPASLVSLTAGKSSLTDIDIGSVDGGSDQTPLDSEPDSTDPDDGTVGPDNAFAARDAYSEILCADSSPCGTYKPFDAASYARKWDLHREYEDDAAARRDHNNNYGYFGGQGGDCQNFVSQSLKAGGLRFMRAEGENSPDGTATGQSSKYHHGEGSWWSMYQETPAGAGSNLPLRSYDVTESFIRSKQLYHHLLDYDLATTEPPGTRVHTGDLLFYNLHGMSIDGTGDIGRDGEPDKGLDHTQIITRVTQNRVYVSQHSPGYTRSLRDVIDNNDDSDSTEPKHVWNTDWRFIIVRPHHTAANIGS
ncbi:MAG: putative amidase domain, partial [Conexibacter sp.]|nr:putative amidase domain [Conexibacter sp.]